MSSLAAQLFRLSPQQRRIWTLAPGGAGNFRLLALIGVALVAVVLLVFWLLSGLMK